MFITYQELVEASKGTDWILEEGIDEIKGIVGEAEYTKALDFFHIVVEEEGIRIPEELDIEEAIKIVNTYLDIVEYYHEVKEEDINIIKKAIKYDKHTKAKRGADDGTFDYAGSFVICILELIGNHNKK